MYKIPIIITNNKKQEILNELKNSNFDLDSINISETKITPKMKVKVNLLFYSIKSKIQIFYQDIKELIKYKKIEPKFGGGSWLDIDSFSGFAIHLFTAIIIPGLVFDVIKTVIKKSYKLLKSKKVNYIMIISEVRQPFDCRVKILIPNNLDDKGLDNVLYQAKEIMTNLDNIRNYFGIREITATCITDYRWKIKFR